MAVAKALWAERRRCPVGLQILCLIVSLFSGLGGLCSAEEESRSRGFEKSKTTSAELENSLAPRRVALVVGIDAYRDGFWQPLQHAGSDAQAVAALLKDGAQGRFERVILLDRPEQLTRAALLETIRRLSTELQRQDTFVFYFSGHGTLELGSDGEVRYYLVAQDTRAAALASTGVELTSLLSFMDQLRPQRRVLIFDSCFSGQGRSRVTPETARRLSAVPNPWSRLTRSAERSDAVLMATTPGGSAIEDDRLGHGVFTWSLLQALGPRRDDADVDGDGAVTPYEAHDFARQLTVSQTKGAQSPEGYFRVSGRGETVLAGNPDPRARREARVYAYGASVAPGVTLRVDGRTRGGFPRTIPIEPGERSLALIQDGKVLAEGMVTLEPASAYPVSELLNALRLPGRALTLETGAQQALSGGILQLTSPFSARTGLGFEWNRRLGPLAGLGLEFGAGLTGSRGGIWNLYAEDSTRWIPDVRAGVLMQRAGAHLSAGLGLRLQGALVPEMAVDESSSTLSPEEQLSLQGWRLLSAGPSARLGWRLNSEWRVVLNSNLLIAPPLHVSAGDTHAEIPAEEAPQLSRLSLQLQHSLGLSRAF